MSIGTFIKDNIKFYFTETDDIKICVCPEKGGELSSVEYKKLLPGKELLFRGNNYSDTNMPFKGRAPLMWPPQISDKELQEAQGIISRYSIFDAEGSEKKLDSEDLAWAFSPQAST